jgi:hypothetical protein
MADDAAPSETPRPTSWLHWLILYPALGTSLFAAIPRVWEEVKALRLGVARSQLQLVEEQARLWEKNLPCITHQGIYEADGEGGLLVRVTLCASGDILVRYHDNDWAPQFRWIARPPPQKGKAP